MHMVYEKGDPASSKHDDWKKLVAEWHSSGMLGGEFSRVKGLNYYDLTKWDHFLSDKTKAAKTGNFKEIPEPEFIEIEFEEDAVAEHEYAEAQSIKLEHINGFTIHIPPQVDPTTIQQLIKVIGEATC